MSEFPTFYVDKYYDQKSWISLSPVEVKEIKRHISPLLDSGLSEEESLAAVMESLKGMEEVLKEYLPNFQHIEKGKSLDSRM